MVENSLLILINLYFCILYNTILHITYITKYTKTLKDNLECIYIYKMYKCKRCTQTYPVKSRLIRHLNGKKLCKIQFDGEDISKEILLEEAKKKIVREYTPIVLKCDKCDKCDFRSSRDLKLHTEKCFGIDVNIWNVPLRWDHNNNGLKRLDDQLLNYIKTTYLRKSMTLIKPFGTTTFHVYENGSWVSYGKFDLMNKLLLRFCQNDSIFTPKSKDIFKYLVSNIENQYNLSDFENSTKNTCDKKYRKYRFFYNNVYNKLFVGFKDPNTILSYKDIISVKTEELIKYNLEAEQDRKNKEVKKNIRLDIKTKEYVQRFMRDDFKTIYASILENINDDCFRRHIVSEIAVLDDDCKNIIYEHLEKDTQIDIDDLVIEVQNYNNF